MPSLFSRHAVRLVAPLLCLAALAPVHGQSPAPFARAADIPVDHFFREPAIRTPRLNSTGTHLAMLVHEPDKDVRSILFLSLADNKYSGIRADGVHDVSRFQWAGPDRVVFAVRRDKRYSAGLFTLKVDAPQEIVTVRDLDIVEVVGSPRTRPDHLLIYISQSAHENGRPGGLLEVDLRREQNSRLGSGKQNIRGNIPVPPGERVLRWFLDRTREPRYAITHHDADLRLYRRTEEDEWTEVKILLDRDTPLAVHVDPALLFVAHLNAQGARELRTFHTETGELGPVLHTDEKYDFSTGNISYSAKEDEVVGLTYARQAMHQVWLRDEEQGLQQSIDAALPPGRLNQIVSRSRDGRRLLIVSSSDRHPGSLYLFDRPTAKLRRLNDLAPWLPEKLMSPVKLLTFKARDGLLLDGYVTLPAGHVEGTPSPMLVLPHGGPWARDIWGYDARSQFFASRGYIVFRPNYRGSTGYHPEISHAPRMEFLKMHEDVTDGVRALIAAKIADPQRIAIFGSSFGGYLALAGAAFEPDLYRCAISFAGVFDWERVLKDDRTNDNIYRYEWLRRDLGDPRTDREKFEAISPYRHVGRIKVPVFVAHGEADRNAETSQSRRLVRALKSAGVPHETLFLSEEAHGLALMKNRVELYTRIEAFLKKHL